MDPKWLIIVEDQVNCIVNWLHAVQNIYPHLEREVKSFQDKLDDNEHHLKSTNCLPNIACHLIKSVDDWTHAKDSLSTTYAHSICFLDLGYKDQTLEEYLSNQLGNLPGELIERNTKAGILLGQAYRPNYDRLLVLASSNNILTEESWQIYLNVPSESMRYVDIRDTKPCWDPETAQFVVNKAISKWTETRIQDHLCANALNLIRASVRDRWDLTDYTFPFYHDFLQSQNYRHYQEICKFLCLDSNNSEIHNSFKSLFQFPTYPGIGNDDREIAATRDPRPITSSVLNQLLTILEIPIVAPVNTNWYFPIKPALPFFLSLKNFFFWCDYPKPELSIERKSFENDNIFILSVSFQGSCKLREKFESKRNKNTNTKIGESLLGGTSGALDNLLRAYFDPKTTEPWAVLFNGGVNSVVDHNWATDNKLQLFWKVKK